MAPVDTINGVPKITSMAALSTIQKTWQILYLSRCMDTLAYLTTVDLEALKEVMHCFPSNSLPKSLY